MTSSQLADAKPASSKDGAAAATEEPSAPGSDLHKTLKLRRRHSLRIGVQSKLLLMLLVCSIFSIAVIGFIGATSGRSALREVEGERLVELRESQRRQVEALFKELKDALIVFSDSFSANEATGAFTAAFGQLGNATISPAQEQALVDYYTTKMIEPIKQLTGNELDLNSIFPTSNAQKYLQAYYTAPPRSGPDAMPARDAGDGSAWSAANARYDYFFRDIVSLFEYPDALLLDLQGNVIYSVKKGPDLGTNILTGPYRGSNLRDAYQDAVRSNDVDFTWITDFQQYQPQLDVPTAWAVSPVGQNGRTVGVMALPLPVSKINRIMTADKQWDNAGMGPSTETYLAGPDNLMRSDSRLFLEDPQEYRREVMGAGTPASVVDKAIRLGGTTLVQPVPSAGLRAAQAGREGTVDGTDYTGNRELEAYAPVSVPDSDLHWSILATRDDSDAFARLARFSKSLVIAVSVMIFVVCVASMVLAQLLLRPVRRLQAGTQKISSGDYEVNIPVVSRDEIGDLTAAFNEMSRNLAIKEELLAEQRKENDRLLLALMPASMVQRYREGQQTIAQQHQDVTIIFADIVGLDEMSNTMSGDELVGIVDDLFRQFDAAAEARGVERIRTFHNGYLASCGVVTPRLDSIHRSVEFALEMRQIIDRFNSQTGHELRLRVGINTGNVVSGLVGRSSLVYDMWGGAVNLAHQMNRGAPQPGIYVSSQVHQVLEDVRQFAPAGTISVGGTDQPIYRLLER